MNQPLHLLLIDDNADDRSLVIRELRREWPNLRADQVSDAASLDIALAADAFDLVITDYHLGWTDGVAILKRVKKLWPDCPVLMFTGTGSEEIAVEAMKLGLEDYVIKSPRHFGRLPAAAQNALRQARCRQEKAEAESNFVRLFDTVPIGLFHMQPDGTILQVNRAFAEMTGYPSASDIRDFHAAQFFITPEDHRAWRDAIERDGTLLRH